MAPEHGAVICLHPLCADRLFSSSFELATHLKAAHSRQDIVRLYRNDDRVKLCRFCMEPFGNGRAVGTHLRYCKERGFLEEDSLVDDPSPRSLRIPAHGDSDNTSTGASDSDESFTLVTRKKRPKATLPVRSLAHGNVRSSRAVAGHHTGRPRHTTFRSPDTLAREK